MEPRGIRNNNPLNIRISNNKWIGKIQNGTDKEFEQFKNMTYGVRAAFVIVRTYMNKYHLRTPAKIIRRWAPEEDGNVTSSYIEVVCKKAGLRPNEILSFDMRNKVCRLVWAMAFYECGQTISFGLVENAYFRV